VDVADDRHHVAHDLALERGEQAQDAVGGRVVRPDVEREQLVVGVDLGAVDGGVRVAGRVVAHALDRRRLLALAVRDAQRVGAVTHTSAGADAR
jgi:hypothetical protein